MGIYGTSQMRLRHFSQTARLSWKKSTTPTWLPTALGSRPTLTWLLNSRMLRLRKPHLQPKFLPVSRSMMLLRMLLLANLEPMFSSMSPRWCLSISQGPQIFTVPTRIISLGEKISGKDFTGRNFYFGIREHAMGTMLNGMAYYGLNIPSGATFLVFADYMRAAIRVASLSELPVSYILTHDSVGVGEDGPTHQPVEATSGLRVIPNLDVIRPADPEEVAGAFIASVDRKDGPTALIFSRQNVRTLNEISVEDRRMGTLKGGYVALKETGPLEIIIMASGSELQWAMDAAKELGAGVRVVSMPCFERFDRQTDAYKAEVLPSSCTKRVAIEAGVTGLWHKYIGLDGTVIGTDKFGFSAPGDVVMNTFGINTENIVKAVKAL